MPRTAIETKRDVFRDADRTVGENLDIRIELQNPQVLGGDRKCQEENQSKAANSPDGRKKQFVAQRHDETQSEAQAVGEAGLPKLTLGASRSAGADTSKNSR